MVGTECTFGFVNLNKKLLHIHLKTGSAFGKSTECLVYHESSSHAVLLLASYLTEQKKLIICCPFPPESVMYHTSKYSL
jgi:hypothetical protein